MAGFNLFEDSTLARTLADGEFGFIAETGALDVSGDAITSSDNALVAVYGSLLGSGSAVDHTGGFLVLQVGETGRIDSGSDTISVDDGGGFFANRGTIDSAQDALDIRGTDSITIVNFGSLLGDSDGIVTRSLGALTLITNRGTIAGINDGGIDHLGGDALVVNRGSISGVSYGYSGATEVDELRNFGSIAAGVFMDASDDLVINSGTIDTVDLGGGDDVYLGRGQGRADSVDGGGGRDRLTSSRADDTFIGGEAGDFFVFSLRGGDDEISDFGGADRIDLSAFGLDSFRADVRGHLVQRAQGTLIDLSDDGLTIFLRDVESADLGGRDFIL